MSCKCINVCVFAKLMLGIECVLKVMCSFRCACVHMWSERRSASISLTIVTSVEKLAAKVWCYVIFGYELRCSIKSYVMTVYVCVCVLDRAHNRWNSIPPFVLLQHISGVIFGLKMWTAAIVYQIPFLMMLLIYAIVPISFKSTYEKSFGWTVLEARISMWWTHTHT